MWAALIPVAEALIYGIGMAFAAHAAGADWQASAIAGLGAAVGKGLPPKVIPTAAT